MKTKKFGFILSSLRDDQILKEQNLQKLVSMKTHAHTYPCMHLKRGCAYMHTQQCYKFQSIYTFSFHPDFPCFLLLLLLILSPLFPFSYCNPALHYFCLPVCLSKHAALHWANLIKKPAYETYRGLGLLLLAQLFWSLDLHIWGTYIQRELMISRGEIIIVLVHYSTANIAWSNEYKILVSLSYNSEAHTIKE